MSNTIQQNISKWYKKNKRPLPWRKDHDPFKVWLSEIILQQTRIDQGTPYYMKFLEAYPDVFALAKAPLDEVLKLWQGLGYYSRARNLHHTAKQIVQEYNSSFPDNYKDLIRLKGIGDYTASIILSVCFNQAHAVVDGNVSRVISRIFGIEDFIDQPAGQKRIKEKATTLLDQEHPGDFNEAMMDFGAMICTPQNPLCEVCPISSACFAFKHDKQDQFPKKSPKKESRKRYFHYFYIESGNQTIVKQRLDKDIWNNLYDLPLVENHSAKALSKTEIADYINSKHFKLEPGLKLKHKLTHQEIHLRFYKIKMKDLPVPKQNWIIIHEKQLGNYAVPKPVEKFINSIKEL